MSRQKQAVAWRELNTYIGMLRVQNGESRDYNMNRLILTIALQMRLKALEEGEQLPNSALADRVGELCRVGSRGGGRTVSVFELIKEWDATKSVIVHSPQTKGHKPRHLTEEQVGEIERFIEVETKSHESVQSRNEA